jgi:hypothetical protein
LPILGWLSCHVEGFESLCTVQDFQFQCLQNPFAAAGSSGPLVDPVHIKRLSTITPGGSNAPHLHARPAAASNTPLPRRPVSSSSTAQHQPSLASLHCSALPGERDEGRGRGPERPGGRQGRNRPQRLGTCLLPPLPSFRRHRPPVLDSARAGGWLLSVVSGSGFKILRRGLRFDWPRGFLLQAKVADLQEAIHARSE